MKYLGIDVGLKRVGVSISDDGGTVAFPFAIVPRPSCIDHISSLIAERSVDVVVIGASYALDGSDNLIMQDVRDIADALREISTVVLMPEQFSTAEAGRLGTGSDAEAATIILQSYLDRLTPGDENIDFG